MKNTTLIVIALVCFTFNSLIAQEDLQLTSKDSIIKNSWIIGVGFNAVDDSGDAFNELFAIEEQWNVLPYPSRISIGRYFKSGLGLEVIGSYNKYQIGKVIDGNINTTESDYLSFDTRLTYDLNKLIGQTAFFDPYIGGGLGYTDANNIGRGTYNAVVGFRTWFSDRIGLDFSASGKWSFGNKATNHIQYAAGIVYQFGIEKALSKKGEKKLAMIEALEKEKQRVNDSIASADSARAAALAERLAREKEAARLAAIEKAKIDADNSRKQKNENAIKDLGYVYFDLNSSYINNESKSILKAIAEILKNETEVIMEIKSHTDSRGTSKYNQWLSQRRVDRTKAYLITQGIDENRLITKAFGEDNLLNDCDDTKYCPEEKHQVNRRSEFIVINF